MGFVQQPHSMEAPPSPLSSRPELRRSVVERSAFQRSFPGNVFRPEQLWAVGPPKVMKNGFCAATTLNGSAALPFVISTGAPKERSGEICVPAVLSWECFSAGAVMGRRPTQGDEKWVLCSNHTQWKRRPPLCHLDRSSEGAQWRDLRSSGPCVEMFPLSTQLWQIHPPYVFNLSPLATLINPAYNQVWRLPTPRNSSHPPSQASWQRSSPSCWQPSAKIGRVMISTSSVEPGNSVCSTTAGNSGLRVNPMSCIPS